MIVVGIIFLIGGVFTIISNETILPLEFVGLFMIIYGVVDFISYFVYQDKGNSNPVREAKVVKEISDEEDENKKNRKN